VLCTVVTEDIAPRASTTIPFHPALEDHDGGHLVDFALAVETCHARFIQHPIRLGGGQALVPEV
jgi:hypothetical protein